MTSYSPRPLELLTAPPPAVHPLLGLFERTLYHTWHFPLPDLVSSILLVVNKPAFLSLWTFVDILTVWYLLYL